MIYQHLPNNKHVHSEATHKKIIQAQSTCCGAMSCAYREDDLAFIFMAKSMLVFKRTRDFLEGYYKSSKDKYKEFIETA